jgi:Predicted membrane protein (DUF2207) C-terminal domain
MMSGGGLSGVVIGSPWIFLFPGAVFLYFAAAWLKVGRDPTPGVDVTQYAPPDGLSPAAVRFIVTGGSDHKSLAAVLASLASKQAISIDPQQNCYRITRQDSTGMRPLAPEEANLLDLLFVPTGNSKDLSDPKAQPAADPRNTPEVAYLRPENTTRNSALVMAIQGSLSKRLGGVYFRWNVGWTLIGVVISVSGALAVAASTASREGVVFLTLWFLLFGLVVGLVFITNVIPALRDAAAGRLAFRSMVSTLLGLVIFTAMPGFVAYKIGEASNWMFVAMLIALLLTNLGWGSVMPSMTERGRLALEQIRGFQYFLEAVEQDRMEVLNHPNSTPQLLNESLAYAIALDVKEAWGDHLCNTFFATTRSR